MLRSLKALCLIALPFPLNAQFTPPTLTGDPPDIVYETAGMAFDDDPARQAVLFRKSLSYAGSEDKGRLKLLLAHAIFKLNATDGLSIFQEALHEYNSIGKINPNLPLTDLTPFYDLVPWQKNSIIFPPHNPLKTILSEGYLFQSGLFYMSHGDLDAAGKMFQASLRVNKREDLARVTTCFLCAVSDTASNYYNRISIANIPSDCLPYLLLRIADNNLSTGNYKKALRFFAQAYQKSIGDYTRIKALIGMGSLYCSMGEKSKCDSVIKMASDHMSLEYKVLNSQLYELKLQLAGETINDSLAMAKINGTRIWDSIYSTKHSTLHRITQLTYHIHEHSRDFSRMIFAMLVSWSMTMMLLSSMLFQKLSLRKQELL